MEQFFNRLKFVSIKDIASVIPMCIGFIISIFYRMIHTPFWLICERENEARDNGFVFFEYMVNNHPEKRVVYAIDKKSEDHSKVASLGETVQFGSLLHWIYYFSAERNISSQKEGKPNAALCFLLEVYLNAVKNRAYIRHGITKDDQRWVYYDVSKIQLFSCAVEREYNFVKERFGYPDNHVKLLGMCRFDKLMDGTNTKRQILLMPTWREWIGRLSSDTVQIEGTKNISEMDFFVKWNEFINSRDLNEALEANEYTMIFYPHSSVQKYITYFQSSNKRIVVASEEEYDVQNLLKESQLLITDYSSVFFDFAYMKKPVIYYQFDYDTYRKEHYKEGYFSYDDDGFGPVCKDNDDAVCEVIQWLNNPKVFDEYLQRIEDFFTFRDQGNCDRTYDAIMNMK